jgi:hypothetical protein
MRVIDGGMGMTKVPDDARQAGGADDEQHLWSRRQFLVGSSGFLVASGVTLFAGQSIVNLARSVIGSPVSTGLVNVYQQDFYFVPNYMTWRVGDRMTLHLQNMSTTRWHEMQIGRHVSMEKTIFGTLTADGFQEDFWDGVHVTFSNPYKIDNLVYNKAIPTFDAPKSEFALTTGGSFSPTLQPGGHIDITFTVPDKPGIWQYG